MAGLTKQHFKTIADIIKKRSLYIVNEVNTTEKINRVDLKSLVTDLSNYFKTQNPLFNENQFKKACLE